MHRGVREEAGPSSGPPPNPRLLSLLAKQEDQHRWRDECLLRAAFGETHLCRHGGCYYADETATSPPTRCARPAQRWLGQPEG